MADNPNPDIDLPETAAPAAKPKRKGIKRRIFLAGSALVVGGGIFGVWWTDSSAKAKGNALIGGEGRQAFGSVMTIAEDDTVTVFSPHIDFGQGSNTALAQMLADELDADWNKVAIEQAPADLAFANAALAKGFLPTMAGETLAG
ncbi:MAG: molybdopterin-dependent oxidoreductase, partial [Porphyrobacter sp.]|nr:molybdopterin-dependent oxidoreductase [Porphyrobacter sp.]